MLFTGSVYGLFSYTRKPAFLYSLGPLARDGTTHSGLGPPTLINSEIVSHRLLLLEEVFVEGLSSQVTKLTIKTNKDNVRL